MMPTAIEKQGTFPVECLVAYGALLANCQCGAFRTQPRVWGHGPMVGEVTLALDARLASLAAGVESRFEVFPRMVECPGWFVLFAGRASVRPGFGRTFVAQPAALSVLAELAELERFAAHAASLVLILLYLVASLADVGVRGEVSQGALLCAPGAP